MTAHVSFRLGDAREVLAIPVGALRENIADGHYRMRVLGPSGARKTRRIRLA